MNWDLECVSNKMEEWANEPQEGRKTMAKTETKNNFKTGYSEYETLDEARKNAQRYTAGNFQTQSIWQRIEETVVPEIDVKINAVEVAVTPVTA